MATVYPKYKRVPYRVVANSLMGQFIYLIYLHSPAITEMYHHLTLLTVPITILLHSCLAATLRRLSETMRSIEAISSPQIVMQLLALFLLLTLTCDHLHLFVMKITLNSGMQNTKTRKEIAKFATNRG